MFNPTSLTKIIRKLPSPIYKLGAQLWIDYNFPRHIFIETTSACNLSCAYCPREKRSNHMDFELFKDIVNECSEHGPRSFSLHLFGESLLYPKILEAIAYIKAKNKANTVLLTTNGTLLNKFIRPLIQHKVDKIIWSYRANNFTEETRKLLKRHGKIRFLIEETPDGEIERWKGARDVEVKHLHNYGGNIDVGRWGLKSANETLTRYPCYHLWLAPAIRWNGEITLCCNIPKSGQEVFDVYNHGALERYWKSDALSQVRESHRKGVYSGACVSCDSWRAYPDIFWTQKCHPA